MSYKDKKLKHCNACGEVIVPRIATNSSSIIWIHETTDKFACEKENQ